MNYFNDPQRAVEAARETAHPNASTDPIDCGCDDCCPPPEPEEDGFHPNTQACVCGGSGWTTGLLEDIPCPYHSYDALDDPPQGCPVCGRLGRDEYGHAISHAACSRAVREGVD